MLKYLPAVHISEKSLFYALKLCIQNILLSDNLLYNLIELDILK